MASVTKLKAGRRAVQVYGHDGVRRMIRLGKITERGAGEICNHIEEIMAATRFGRVMSEKTEKWLIGVGDDFYARLHDLGIVPARGASTATLGPTLDAMIARRTDWKIGQQRAMKTARRRLAKFFGEDRRPRTITVAEAKDFRRHLRQGDPANKIKPLAIASVSKMVKNARSYFADMVEGGLVRENVFLKVEAGSQENAARMRYIDDETIRKVLAVCPNDEWRAIIALARYAGLRTPSETLLLKWEDIQWDAHRIRIHSPKTAGKGKAQRFCPLLPEVREVLARHAIGADATGYVVELHRYTARGFRDNMLDFVKRAGLTAWPKLWQNLRASCGTDFIEAGEPITLVAAWIGNTAAVLERHYMIFRDAQFVRASNRESRQPRHELPSNDTAAISVARMGFVMSSQPMPSDLVGRVGRTDHPRKRAKSREMKSRASRSASRHDLPEAMAVLRRQARIAAVGGGVPTLADRGGK